MSTLSWSSQYDMPCVVVENDDTADHVLKHCLIAGAVRHYDGEEFCVKLRDDVGPELWTEESLRRSLATPEATDG